MEPKAAGNRGKGRPKGSKNKFQQDLKGAILEAATSVGEDGKGNGGLVGYCKGLAVSQPQAFASLLGRVLPTQVKASVTHKLSDLNDEQLAALAAIGATRSGDTESEGQSDQLH